VGERRASDCGTDQENQLVESARLAIVWFARLAPEVNGRSWSISLAAVSLTAAQPFGAVGLRRAMR
jgi:hypothetical protein